MNTYSSPNQQKPPMSSSSLSLFCQVDAGIPMEDSAPPQEGSGAIR